MRTEEIRSAWKRQPFRPFTLHLNDGREFSVVHPDFLLVNPAGRTVVVVNIEGDMEIIDTLSVNSISTVGESAPRNDET